MSSDPLFRMTITQTISMGDRGTVLSGQVEAGTLKIGDQVYIQRASGEKLSVPVTGIQVGRKVAPQARAGDTIGVLVVELQAGDAQRGDVMTGA